jgi:hypothetical protein
MQQQQQQQHELQSAASTLSLLGLGLIFFSLIMDMVTGGLQDKVKKSTKELNPDAGEKPVPLPSTSPRYL